jgi:hypothetical protein
MVLEFAPYRQNLPAIGAQPSLLAVLREFFFGVSVVRFFGRPDIGLWPVILKPRKAATRPAPLLRR